MLLKIKIIVLNYEFYKLWNYLIYICFFINVYLKIKFGVMIFFFFVLIVFDFGSLNLEIRERYKKKLYINRKYLYMYICIKGDICKKKVIGIWNC